MTNKPNGRRRLKSAEEVPIPSETISTVDKENIPDEAINPTQEPPNFSPEDSSTCEKVITEESSNSAEETPKNLITSESLTVDPEVSAVLEELLKAVVDGTLTHRNPTLLPTPFIKKPKRKYVRRTFNNEPKLKKLKQEEVVTEPKELEIPQPVIPFFINPNLNYHDLMMSLCVQMRVPYQYDINDRGRDLKGVMKNFIEKTKVIIKGADEPGAENVMMPSGMDTKQLLLPDQPMGKDEPSEVKPFSGPSSAFTVFSEPKSADITAAVGMGH